MNTSNSNTLSTPSNYYGPTGQPAAPRDYKKPFIIASIIAALAIVVAIIAVSVIGLTSNNEGGSSSLVITRENNPMLELYATLDEKMTLEDLQKAISNSGLNAEIFIEYDAGTISTSDSPEDFIYFYIDRKDPKSYTGDSSYIDDDDESMIGAKEEKTESVNMLDTYQPEDTTYFFRYAHMITEDENIGITYYDDEDIYDVYDGFELYSFPTKKEAIEAYLSPEAKQSPSQ